MDGLVKMTQGIGLPSHARSSGAPGNVTRILAALGPKMLELSRDRADGAHPYLVPPEQVAVSREILGPDRLLISEQGFLLSIDAAQARAMARDHVAFYLQMPAFQAVFRQFGYSDDDLSNGGSNRTVDALVVWGDETAVVEAAKRVGATPVVLDVTDLDIAVRLANEIGNVDVSSTMPAFTMRPTNGRF